MNLSQKKIARELVKIKLGELEKMYIGNLDAKRDWGFAPDYVKGMHAMLQHSEPDDFVLATGKTTTVRDFIEFCAVSLEIEIGWTGTAQEEVGFDKKTQKIIVEVSKEFFRPAEVDVLLGDATKAREILGWRSQTNIKELAEIMVDHEKENVR